MREVQTNEVLRSISESGRHLDDLRGYRVRTMLQASQNFQNPEGCGRVGKKTVVSGHLAVTLYYLGVEHLNILIDFIPKLCYYTLARQGGTASRKASTGASGARV